MKHTNHMVEALFWMYAGYCGLGEGAPRVVAQALQLPSISPVAPEEETEEGEMTEKESDKHQPDTLGTKHKKLLDKMRKIQVVFEADQP